MELDLQALNLPSDNERPFVIAGPCSAETEEQVMTTAMQLAAKGCHNFRAGVWKHILLTMDVILLNYIFLFDLIKYILYLKLDLNHYQNEFGIKISFIFYFFDDYQ